MNKSMTTRYPASVAAERLIFLPVDRSPSLVVARINEVR